MLRCLTLATREETEYTQRCPLGSHYLVCIKNYLFNVGIGPIRDKEIIFIF